MNEINEEVEVLDTDVSMDKKENKKEKKSKEKEKIKQLEEQLVEADAKMKYAQAELINFRRRKEEESVLKMKYANQELIFEILLILDNFERAIKLDDNDLTDELSKFLDGFKMMYGMLSDTLKRFGVEEINPIHQVFDANTSQALMTDSDFNYEDDIVLEVLLKGYKLHDRIIRPASVKINKI